MWYLNYDKQGDWEISAPFLSGMPLLELNECCKGLGVCWCILEMSLHFWSHPPAPSHGGNTQNVLEFLSLDCIGSQSTHVQSRAIRL